MPPAAISKTVVSNFIMESLIRLNGSFVTINSPPSCSLQEATHSDAVTVWRFAPKRCVRRATRDADERGSTASSRHAPRTSEKARFTDRKRGERRRQRRNGLGLVGLGLLGDVPLIQASVAHIRDGAALASQQHNAGIALARRTLWAMGSRGGRGRRVAIHVGSHGNRTSDSVEPGEFRRSR